MSVAKKLLIKPGYRVAVVNAPDGFAFSAEELPDGVEVLTEVSGPIEFVLLFARDQAELKKFTPAVMPHLMKDALFWVAYPKKSSKIKSDITRDSGWELLKEAGYQGVSLISIDDTWSAFRLRHETAIKKK